MVPARFGRVFRRPSRRATRSRVPLVLWPNCLSVTRCRTGQTGGPTTHVPPSPPRPAPGRREAADEESRGAGPRERPGRDEAADEDADGGGRDADGATEPPDDGTGAPRPEGDGAASRAPGEAGTVPQAPASQEAVPVPGTSSRSAVPDPVAGGEPAVEPVLRILPLGSGLMLIGLGLGLAFVALRMRQGGGVP